MRSPVPVFVALALGLVTASPATAIARTRPSKAAAKDEGPDLQKIGKLAQEAQTRFETADYPAAIELWTQAYAALPAEPAYAGQRGVLVYQIAQACVEAYSIDPQVLYLRKAERLLSSYLETLGSADQDTAASVKEQLAEIEGKIAEAEAASVGPESDLDEVVEVEEAPDEDGVPSEESRVPGRGLVIAGGALLGAGALGLGAMTFGLLWGARVDARGEAAVADGEEDPAVFRDLLKEGTTANRLAIGAGAGAGALLITGAILVGIGVKRRKGAPHLALAPLGLRGGGGLVLGGRF